MVRQQTMTTKPSRSDEVLDADQQLEITNQVRAQFESLAPKRPAKPSRSESDSTTPPISNISDQDYSVPELDKLKSLQSQSQAIFTGAGTVEQEEFVETQYYKELDSIDKLHHTTGGGFIRVASEIAGNDYDLQWRGGHENSNGNSNGGIRPREFKSNPATNDWIPSIEDHQVAGVSSKPNRSESS